MTRRTRCLLTSLFVLAVLLGIPAWLTWRAVRQERLDRALIGAVSERKTDTVASLLKRGADANASDGRGINPFLAPKSWFVARFYPNSSRIYSASALVTATANGD